MLNCFFFFYRQLPSTKRLKEKIYSGYWDRTTEDNYRLEMIKRNLNPDMKDLMAKREELSKKDPIVPIKV